MNRAYRILPARSLPLGEEMQAPILDLVCHPRESGDPERGEAVSPACMEKSMINTVDVRLSFTLILSQREGDISGSLIVEPRAHPGQLSDRAVGA